MLFLALALIAGAVGFVFYMLLSDAEEKATVRSSLRQLEGYEVQDVRDQELLIPLYQRALLPILKGLTALGGRFTPVGYVDTVRKKFVYAGRISADGVDRFLAIRVITVVLIPAWFIFVTVFLPVTGILRLGALGLGGAILALGPDSVLNRRVEERQYDHAAQAAGHPRPADHQRRSRPRLRAGRRPDGGLGPRAAVRRVRPDAG